MNQQTVPQGEVLLYIKARGLKSRDTFSKSDPMAVVFEKVGQEFKEVGRTEAYKDVEDVDFKKELKVTYYFEREQVFRVTLYDVDNVKKDLKGQDVIGSVDFTLSELLGGGDEGAEITKSLMRKGKKAGTIIILGEGKSQMKAFVHIKASCVKLAKKDMFGSDPYYEIHKEVGSDFVRVYKSEVYKKELNPKFEEAKLDFSSFCGGDVKKRLKFIVYDWNKSGKPDLIGEFVTTVEQIVNKPEDSRIFDLIEPKKLKKKKYKNSGTFVFDVFKLERIPSFFDYLRGGLDITMCFGIDFTGSNGSVTDPSGLHYLNPQFPNQYQKTLMYIGNIVAPYSRTQMFPAFGFGCKVNGQLSHMFPINGNPSNPACPGVQGVLQAYTNILMSGMLTFWGPTNFSPIISGVAQIAKQAQEANSLTYYTLIMITDGAITDMKKTKREIVAASSLPMSIIIIGVGDEDFSKMEELDSDDNLLRDDLGNVAERDMVQFVEFNRYKDNLQMLASQTLYELPNQVEKYYTSRGIVPKGFEY